MQTRTLRSIVFFKEMVCKLTDYYMNWSPLVELYTCVVKGNLHYRHIMLYIYATKSDYINYNYCYREEPSNNENSFKLYWSATVDDQVYVITDNILNGNRQYQNMTHDFHSNNIFEYLYSLYRIHI